MPEMDLIQSGFIDSVSGPLIKNKEKFLKSQRKRWFKIYLSE